MDDAAQRKINLHQGVQGSLQQMGHSDASTVPENSDLPMPQTSELKSIGSDFINNVEDDVIEPFTGGSKSRMGKAVDWLRMKTGFIQKKVKPGEEITFKEKA